jgi:splicing factor 3A subunit 1
LFVNAEDAKRREAEELANKKIWEEHTQSASLQASQQKAQKATGLPITAGSGVSPSVTPSQQQGSSAAKKPATAPISLTAAPSTTNTPTKVPSISSISLPGVPPMATPSPGTATSTPSIGGRAPPIGASPFGFGMGMPPFGYPMMPGMPMPPGGILPGRPLLPGHVAPPLSSAEPQTKKAKVAAAAATTGVKSNQKSEEEFMALFPGSISIQVLIPNESENKEWKFNGQTLDLTLDIKDTLTILKDRLNKELGMPQGKMKINIQSKLFHLLPSQSVVYR